MRKMVKRNGTTHKRQTNRSISIKKLFEFKGTVAIIFSKLKLKFY
jgi:hypothetical protein